MHLRLKTFAINPLTGEVFTYDEKEHSYAYWVVTTNATEARLYDLIEKKLNSGTFYFSSFLYMLHEAGHVASKGIKTKSQ